MTECRVCGDNTSFEYTCKRCGGSFCVGHRHPESHVCIGLRAQEPELTIEGELDEEVQIDVNPSGPKPMELNSSHRVGAGPEVSDVGERSPDVNLDGSIKQDDGDEEEEVTAAADSGGVFGRIRALVPF